MCVLRFINKVTDWTTEFKGHYSDHKTKTKTSKFKYALPNTPDAQLLGGLWATAAGKLKLTCLTQVYHFPSIVGL